MIPLNPARRRAADEIRSGKRPSAGKFCKSLPFLFIFNTELLLIDVTLGKAVFVFIVSVIAMLLFAAATQNWFLTRSRIWESAALLLIAFTLFRPGFWLDQISDPYERVPASQIIELSDAAEDQGLIRARLAGEDFATGRLVETTVELPLGDRADGDGPARLDRHSGISFRIEDDDRVFVDLINFGQYAESKGIDFDWEVQYVEAAAARMPKEVFYLPALALLGVIGFLQINRARRRQSETAR